MTSEVTLRRRAWAVGVAGYAVLTASCAVLGPDGEQGAAPHAFAFDHAVHAENDLECADCHEGEGGAIVLPTLEACLECHEDEEDEGTAATLAGLQARPADARWVRYTVAEELRFAHEAHGAVACDRCHGDLTAMAATSPAVRPTMATCTDCHAVEAPERNDCATCHEERRRDVAPASHQDGWRWDHGVLARHGDLDGLLQQDCGFCHERNTCIECHRTIPPRSHSQFFRIRGHGLMAGNDRASCESCHTVNACIRCHQVTRPVSHRGAWGPTPSRHCLTCHEGQAEQGCAMCHTDGAPSHAQAAPLPAMPPHNPAMNCRQCHGLSAPLPHVDNGAACTACHQ